ncbi:DUF3891 family protein [Maribacter sp. X9]|uniref:DUF3891 family protein n=1 Tax=Maribacter sp. X9 TaxID=3402159 RepID=UPI003AF3CAE2
MIVRHHIKGWKIISHYTHALLSGKIAAHLENNLIPSHWPETLTAIINHDDRIEDFDSANYLTEAGTPRDFTMDGGSTKDAVEHAANLYRSTLQKSQWISILVSRHLEFLYQDLEDNEMKKLVKHMHAKRKEQRKLYGINLDIENRLYNILLFCDRLSLIICGDEIPETGRKLEINKTINNTTYFIAKNEDSSFSITPWIFSSDHFEVDFEYKIIEQTTFSSNKELEKEIKEAKVLLKRVAFRK